MFTNLKDILIAITIVSACCMIKCKMDKDASQNQDISTSTLTKDTSVSKVDTNTPPVISNSTKDTTQEIDNNKIAEQYRSEKTTTTIESEIKQEKKTLVKKKKRKKASKAIAKIEFEEITWDFGEITEGDIIKKKFKFTNTGKAPLQIIGADASCGCARPIVPFLDIAPGESSEIGVTYNSVNKDGDQSPEIIIESNTYPRNNILKLKGTVIPKPKDNEKMKLDSLKVKQDSIIKN